jgi:hypothetical protein
MADGMRGYDAVFVPGRRFLYWFRATFPKLYRRIRPDAQQSLSPVQNDTQSLRPRWTEGFEQAGGGYYPPGEYEDWLGLEAIQPEDVDYPYIWGTMLAILNHVDIHLAIELIDVYGIEDPAVCFPGMRFLLDLRDNQFYILKCVGGYYSVGCKLPKIPFNAIDYAFLKIPFIDKHEHHVFATHECRANADDRHWRLKRSRTFRFCMWAWNTFWDVVGFYRHWHTRFSV